MIIEKALEWDLEEILKLQKLAYISEAEICNDFSIPPLTQTYEEIKEEYKNRVFLKAITDGKIVGSVRADEQSGICNIGKLIVHPEFQNKGIGTKLMSEIEKYFKACKKYELFTGKMSVKNIYFYNKLGYEIYKEVKVSDTLTFVYLEKQNNFA